MRLDRRHSDLSAGGPHAPLRYAVERALSVNITAQSGHPVSLNL